MVVGEPDKFGGPRPPHFWEKVSSRFYYNYTNRVKVGRAADSREAKGYFREKNNNIPNLPHKEGVKAHTPSDSKYIIAFYENFYKLNGV